MTLGMLHVPLQKRIFIICHDREVRASKRHQILAGLSHPNRQRCGRQIAPFDAGCSILLVLSAIAVIVPHQHGMKVGATFQSFAEARDSQCAYAGVRVAKAVSSRVTPERNAPVNASVEESTNSAFIIGVLGLYWDNGE